jgi:hypothetical protein
MPWARRLRQPTQKREEKGSDPPFLLFAEATLMPPVIDVFRHTRLKPEPERIPAVLIDARARAAAILTVADGP